MTDRNEKAFSALLFTWVAGWGTGAVSAAVAMKGWEWFIADTFDWPTLSFVQAWGLFMVISFATLHANSDQKSDYSPMQVAWMSIFSSLFKSGLYFLSLWILSGWL